MKLPLLPLFALVLSAAVPAALSAADAPMPAPASAGAPAAAAPKVASSGGISPHETISVHIPAGNSSPIVTITYGRPFSNAPRGGAIRKVWGTLVPWDKPWRLGSDEATSLLLPLPMVIGATTIPPGAYTLYLVPSESGVTKLAFSSNIGKWGIPVDAAHDVARVDLTKGTVTPQVDELTLSLTNDPAAPATGGILKITWETTQFTLPFTMKK